VEPELFSSKTPGLQVVTGVVVPAVFGLVTGLLLGVTGVGYLALSVLGIAGGYFAGLEHRTVEEGFLRGVTGGLLFGTFILVGHEISGVEPKADLPHPEILLVVLTTVFGSGLGALGARSRVRRRRRPPTRVGAEPGPRA
jgi:membrane-bound ClpP family serine protease